MYAVVIFASSHGDEVEVVPKSWLAAGDSCWWPTGMKGSTLKKAVEERAPPQRDSWTLFKGTRVLAISGIFYLSL